MLKRTLSGIMLTLLLIGMLALTFNIQAARASGTIYIRADGSIDPSTAPISTVDNVTYTFTGNISGQIVVEKSNIIIDGDGYTLKNPSGGWGVYSSDINNVTLQNMNIVECSYCIRLESTSFITVSQNNLSTNICGVSLESSSFNTICGNHINATSHAHGAETSGIALVYSSYNNVSNNNIANIEICIELSRSSYNNVSENNIANNIEGVWWPPTGVYLSDSSSSTICGNSITNNKYSMYIISSSDNTIYHNNFINSTLEVETTNSVNIWDDGYPSGGNYWSDYTSVDYYSGPYQNETRSDGIGDTSYIIDSNNTDNYPLMQPYHGSVRNLNTGQSYPTIQKGINNASQNDRILVLSGTYYENVVVNKTICLIGEDKGTTVIDGVQKGHVINVAADNVTITDFTIANSSSGSIDSGIYLYGINGCNITQNNVIDNNIGVFLAWASNNNISGNNIAENSWCGIYLSYSSNNNVISLNNLEANNHYGIGLLHSSNINDIHGNNMTKNYYGIGLGSFSSYNVIFGNDIANNHQGIGLYEFSTNNVISGNNITANNQYGIYLRESSNNRFYHNNFINNTDQVYLTDSFNNTWDNGCEGNYWSNYDGTDLDGDGIGDTYLPCEGVDYYPLMNPYWLPGDVNHDLKIDIYDVVKITAIYGSEQGDLNWNPHSDIAEPYGIINIYDVVTCTKDYRKEYTP